MGRSSRLAFFALAVASLPRSASASPFVFSDGYAGYGPPFGTGFGLGGIDVVPSPPAPALGPDFDPASGPLVQAPPRCPLIIEVGRGLRHRVKSRVISGRRGCV